MIDGAVLTVTVGKPGAHKSYSRVRWLFETFIPEYEGTCYTNLPVNLDAFASYCKAKYNMEPEDVWRRVVQIPSGVIRDWRNCSGRDPRGPWEWFTAVGLPLQGAHIIIDEAHEFWGQGQRDRVAARKQLREWLATLRHEGCSIEFITQDESSIDRDALQRATRKLVIANNEAWRDPFFSIRNRDWYELQASFFREWIPRVRTEEYTKADQRWRRTHTTVLGVDSQYYRLYDSYNVTRDGQQKAQGDRQLWKEKTRAGMVAWFLRRNGVRLVFSKTVFLVGIVVFLLSGGGMWAMNTGRVWLQNSISGITDPTASQSRPGQASPGASASGLPARDAPGDGLPESSGMYELVQGEPDLEAVIFRTDINGEIVEYGWQDYAHAVYLTAVYADALESATTRIEALEAMHGEAYVYELQAIARDWCVINGRRYYYGDLLYEGDFQSVQVQSGDSQRGTVRLGNGHILHIDRMREREPRNTGAGHELMDRGAPSVDDGSAGSKGNKSPGRAHHDERRSSSSGVADGIPRL